MIREGAIADLPEITRIRGVAADSVVANLVERGLLAEAGRSDDAGAIAAPGAGPLVFFFEREFERGRQRREKKKR